MAATAALPFPLPGMAEPPRLDLDRLFGLHRATLRAVQEAQGVLLDAAQAIFRLQYGYWSELAHEAQAVLASPPAPEVLLAGVKASAEKGAGIAKQSFDLAVGAQQHASELLARQVRANLAEAIGPA